MSEEEIYSEKQNWLDRHYTAVCVSEAAFLLTLVILLGAYFAGKYLWI